MSKLRINNIRQYLCVSVFALILSGCGGDEFDDLQEFVKKSGDDLRGQVEAPPEVKIYEPFLYDNSAELTDPFKPRKQDNRQGGGIAAGLNQPDLTRPKQELEEYPLESLKMVGFLKMGKAGNAVIRSSTGKVYRVKAGNYIGMNFGKIISVSETEVNIKEMIQDSGGDWVERENSLQLVE